MDPVRTEVMKNRFAAIAEEASNVAYRTAYTTFVKQTQDYQVALANRDGEFFAYPVRSGVTSSVCQNVRPMVDEIGIDNLLPGDIIISNDPFSGGALCTHSMDVHMIRPVFRDGEIVAFGWAFIHASDIGGAVPGSISPTSREVFQEGVRMRPNLLYRKGKLNTQLWNFFADNSRIPDLIWGDLQAMLAGLALLDTRTQELCERYGKAGFLEGVADVIALSELKARQAIGRLADGEYVFNDYLETHAGKGHIYLQARLTIRGEELEVDCTGSDPQVPFSLNFVTGDRPHPFLCMPIINYILTVEPTVPMTGGIMRPMKTRSQPGSIMNAEFPAAMGNRWVAVMRVYDAILGCLNQAVPGGLAAAGAGQAGIIAVAAFDETTGRQHVSVVEPFVGGTGGRCNGDGVDGIDTPVGFLRSAPIEVVELETPFLVRRFMIERDSFGPGRNRGGGAVRIEMENRGLGATVTVRGLDRFRFQPWGAMGGGAGRSGRTVLNPGTPEEREIGKIDVLELKEGDILHMVTPAGGGFGDPFERDPEKVLADVVAGLISPERAREDYGVAIAGERVDAAATALLRAARRNDRLGPAYALGPVRSALEERWPPSASAALAGETMRAPLGIRPYVIETLRRRLDRNAAPVTVAAVHEAARTLFAERWLG
jgi:N-methylhydantoinase B